jgi:hypothetical protein
MTPSLLRSRCIAVARVSSGGTEVERIEREGGESAVDREGKRTMAQSQFGIERAGRKGEVGKESSRCVPRRAGKAKQFNIWYGGDVQGG